MNYIDTILENAGLSPGERTVYCSALGHENLTSSSVTKLSRLPRPTVMAALQRLVQYKLCLTMPIDGRSLGYTMQPLHNLKMHLGQKIQEVENLMQTIDSLPLEQPTAIQVGAGTGQQHLQEYLELALRCRSRQWRIMAPRDNALRHLPPDYIAYFKRVRSEQQISSETLWEHAVSKMPVDLMDTLMRKPRYLPEGFAKKIPSVLLSFDDSILFITGTKQPSCSLVTDKDVATSFNIVFDLGWRFCRKGDGIS